MIVDETEGPRKPPTNATVTVNILSRFKSDSKFDIFSSDDFNSYHWKKWREYGEIITENLN